MKKVLGVGFGLILGFFLLQLFVVWSHYQPGSMFSIRKYFFDLLQAFDGIRFQDWTLNAFGDTVSTWREFTSVFKVGSENFLDIFHAVGNLFLLIYNGLKVVVFLIGNGFVVIWQIFNALWTFTGVSDYWIPNSYQEYFSGNITVPIIPPFEL